MANIKDVQAKFQGVKDGYAQFLLKVNGFIYHFCLHLGNRRLYLQGITCNGDFIEPKLCFGEDVDNGQVNLNLIGAIEDQMYIYDEKLGQYYLDTRKENGFEHSEFKHLYMISNESGSLIRIIYEYTPETYQPKSLKCYYNSQQLF